MLINTDIWLTEHLNVSSGDAELIFTDTIISSLVSPVGQSYRQSGAEQTVFCFHQNITILQGSLRSRKKSVIIVVPYEARNLHIYKYDGNYDTLQVDSKS